MSRDDDEVELSIRIHAIRKLKPFVFSSHKQTLGTESIGCETSISAPSIENARVLAFCDFKPALSAHTATALPANRDQTKWHDGSSTARWSAPSSRRSSINDGEVTWSELGGTLRWAIKRLGLRHCKSFCPKLKIQLFALTKTFMLSSSTICKAEEDLDTIQSEESCFTSMDSNPRYWSRRTTKPLGWVVVDIRDFEHAIQEKIFKVKSGWSIGSEVILTLNCLPVHTEINPIIYSDKYSIDDHEGESAPFPLDTEFTGSPMPLGRGNAIFCLTVRLESANCFHSLGTDRRGADGWLSYSIFERVVQTDKFSFTTRQSLNPVEDAFRIRCSVEEIHSYFSKNSLLKIYICTQKKGLIGSVTMDLSCLIIGLADNEKKEVRGKYLVDLTHKYCDDSSLKEEPSIEASAFLELVSSDEGLSDAKSTPMDMNERNFKQRAVCCESNDLENVVCKKNSIQRCEYDDQIYSKDGYDPPAGRRLDPMQDAPGESGIVEKSVHQDGVRENSEAAIDLERRHLEWQSWRHKQELQWHEKLRYKEETVMKRLEERAREKEKERYASMESCRLEYSKLEGKLRKALNDVEGREHQLMLQDAARQEEFSRKSAELDKKHRAVLEEARHSLNLEKAKCEAAVERAILAEKKHLSAESKLQKTEKELEKLAKRIRESSEMTLLQEIAQLKGQVAEFEVQVKREHAECKKALEEKEQYKNQINRLAKLLRREQDRSGAHKRKEIEQLRLEFLGREERMQLDGDRAELQLIKNELRALNLAPNKSESCLSEAGFTNPRQFHGPNTITFVEHRERDDLVSNRSSDSIHIERFPEGEHTSRNARSFRLPYNEQN